MRIHMRIHIHMHTLTLTHTQTYTRFGIRLQLCVVGVALVGSYYVWAFCRLSGLSSVRQKKRSKGGAEGVPEEGRGRALVALLLGPLMHRHWNHVT